MGSSKSKIQKEGKPRYWYRDNFMLTNDKSYMDPKTVNDVFKSDLMWWNDPLDLMLMRKMLDSCLTFGIYAVPDTEEYMMSMFFPLLEQPPTINICSLLSLDIAAPTSPQGLRPPSSSSST